MPKLYCRIVRNIIFAIAIGLLLTGGVVAQTSATISPNPAVAGQPISFSVTMGGNQHVTNGAESIEFVVTGGHIEVRVTYTPVLLAPVPVPFETTTAAFNVPVAGVYTFSIVFVNSTFLTEETFASGQLTVLAPQLVAPQPIPATGILTLLLLGSILTMAAHRSFRR